MPLLHADPRFLDHQTGNHPESPERLRFLHEHLAASGVLTRFARREWAAASSERLTLVHDPDHVAAMRELATRGGGHADADTVVGPRS